jgi:pilus assembly protein Flp/PilA
MTIAVPLPTSKEIYMLKSLIADESGATMVEYGIMVALIAALSIAVIKSLGSKVSNAFSSVDTKMP